MAKSQNKGGRPTKFTPEVREKILAAIRAGNYAGVAADYAGVGETTFYRWLQKGREAKSGKFREFWVAVKKAEREAEVRAVAQIQKHMDSNWQAAMTYLERKHPDRWGRRDRLQVEINPRQALGELLSLSDDDLDAVIDQAARKE